MLLVREMPVLAAARIIGVTDKRLWRVIRHYVTIAMSWLDLSQVKAVALDETASKRGHNYVTVFIDLNKKQKPVLFVTPGKGKTCLSQFKDFLKQHGGRPDNVAEVVCDMSPAFLAAIGESFPQANVTVDWFHVVQLFSKAVDDVRRAEARERKMPKASRWAVLKAADGGRLTAKQQIALHELETRRLRHSHRLADQGAVTLGAKSRNPKGREMAHYPLLPARPKVHRPQHAEPGTGAQILTDP